MCIEKLSHLINDRVRNRSWKAIKPGRRCPPISHLFFADDLLLFGEASEEQADVMLECLEEVTEISGQKVSIEKDRIMVSKKTSRATTNTIHECSRIPITSTLGK